MKVVVLTFDRLPASLLGCYGNEWVETPRFDRLAAESTVFPSAFAEIPGPASSEHPWWTGRFEFFGKTEGQVGWVSDPTISKAGVGTESQPTSPGSSQDFDPTLFEILSESGVSFRFLSERAEGLPPRGVAVESESTSGPCFEIVSGEDGLDAGHSEVPFAKLVQRATEILDRPGDEVPDLLWLHSRGVPSPWLPPEFFAGLYLDELEDQDESEASGREIADALLDQLRDEPDLVRLLLSDPADDADDAAADAELIAAELGELGERVRKYVFAGYVSLIDHCLQALTEAISRRDDVLLLVTATGGVSFGERAAFLANDAAASELAEADDDVCDSLLRVPLLIRPAGPAAFGNRNLRLTQPPDIYATILDCLSPAARASTVSLLQPMSSDPEQIDDEVALHLGTTGTLAIRTGDWLLTVPDGLEALQTDAGSDELTDQAGLYAQPDDRWMLNNLTRQQPGMSAELLDRLSERTSSST
jgi:arylsulfatase A-like enzyme